MALQRLVSVDDAAAWLTSRGATSLATDSRRLRTGDAFVAWAGNAHDARDYVRPALGAGAPASLVDSDGVDSFGFDDARIAAFDGLKPAAGPIASRFLGAPSERLRVVACTGTNGKTSTAWWIAQALGRLGQRCGIVGTLGIGEPPVDAHPQAASLASDGMTTPDPVALQRALHDFVDAGFAAAAIEASSIGIAEHRLAGTKIDIALFTNFTQDHLDYHGDMGTYWLAKARLFEWPGLRVAVVNIDDLQGLELAEQLGTSALDLWTCACSRDARLRASAIRHGVGGLSFEVEEGGDRAEVRTALVGRYNVSNLLGVIGVLRACGYALADAAAACAALTPVPGRMQPVGSGAAGPQVVVDYAHTPDALDKALAALRPFADERGGKLWCVFGCGGNRDAAKRPLMGAIACRLADRVVVTSDNPRHEPPDFIISQILAGVVGHDEIDVIEFRADAVRHAVVDADVRDVILVAGKGHEDYQDVAGVKHPYSDVAAVEAALQQRMLQ
ncbi:MAG: UDP-N-acetylmuramoyl-L-alanyl-D-glutamate--2,6-diaminopimelate ligase [Caldimonas sp.]